MGLCAKVMEVNKDEEAIRLLCEFLVHLSKAIWEGRVILPGRRGSRSPIVSSQEDGGACAQPRLQPLTDTPHSGRVPI